MSATILLLSHFLFQGKHVATDAEIKRGAQELIWRAELPTTLYMNGPWEPSYLKDWANRCDKLQREIQADPRFSNESKDLQGLLSKKNADGNLDTSNMPEFTNILSIVMGKC